MDWSRRTFLKTVSGLVGAVVGGLLVRRAVRGSVPSPLRPPGARNEQDFLARCIRCQQCIAACPKDVLQVAPPVAGLSIGTPLVVARDLPCDLCQGQDEMRCIPACPTGAHARGPPRRRADGCRGHRQRDMSAVCRRLV